MGFAISCNPFGITRNVIIRAVMPQHQPNELIELSEREREILKLVATGASNKEIALQLFISANTVKVHLRNVFVKIGVISRTEAAMYAVKKGLVTGVSPQLRAVETQDTVGMENPSADTVSSGKMPNPEPPMNGVLEKPELAPSRRTRYGVVVVVLSVVLVTLVATLVLILRRTPSLLGVTGKTATANTFQRWSRLADMPTARSGLAAVSVENQVYAIGGTTLNGITGIVEQYDPQSDTWQSGASKPLPVSDVSAVVIGGKIYVPGGVTVSGQVTDALEIYDPVLKRWEQGASLPEARSAYAIATFEGKLYLFGGTDGASITATTFVYIPQQNLWINQPSMPTARVWASAAVANSKIHVIGGFDGKQSLTTHEIFQPQESSPIAWSNGVSLPQGRQGLCAVTIADFLFVFGGINADSVNLTPIQLVPQDIEWHEMDDWKFDNLSKFGAVVMNGRVFVIGGMSDQNLINRVLSVQVMYTIMFPAVP